MKKYNNGSMELKLIKYIMRVKSISAYNENNIRKVNNKNSTG